MTTSKDYRRKSSGLLSFAVLLLTTLALTLAPTLAGQSKRERVEGVRNFGRVTDNYMRGGQPSPEGIKNLADLGVRTVIDLRDDESPGEAEACEKLGIKYYKFPMNGHVTPDDKVVEEVLSIIQNSKEPIYVHCSAGKHRAGTIAALYRLKVQGWTKEQAWAEQQSYGFGTPQEHPALYAYVYGQPQVASTSPGLKTATVKEEQDSNKSKEKKESNPSKQNGESRDDDDDDDDDKDDDDDGEDEDKDDDDDGEDDDDDDKDDDDGEDDDDDGEDDDDDDDSDKRKDIKSTESISKQQNVSTSRENSTAAAAPASKRVLKSLSADGGYIHLSEAIKLARDAGGTGDILKVDLEWDAVRSLATWDLTFASGTEYEFEATSGKMIGTKAIKPAKLAVHTPIDLESKASRMLSFTDIIKKAEADFGQLVLEMELKRIKGTTATVFEVVLEDGSTFYFDATTGEKLASM